ncbi:putative Transmembrane protein [Thalictrum thalictroides]|uniref:Putative Transmembrane protein n=1 Tax=Thalictrum thalictroides TaxID=46969 RepID=A0A7J6W2X0_THATH|nr:putative Transmembrane protein [Thalictrum thalictroides]
MIIAQQIEAAHVFDHVLGRYAFESYNAHNKTGFLYEVQFPGNLSDIRADTVRFRCGSLKRYGAQIKEFSLAMGVTVQPCVERVLIVRQNLGEHWSPIYFDTTNVSATYQLVSYVLGLVAYDATNLNSTNLSEVELHAGKNPIKIDFGNVVKINSTSDITLLCASFNSDGKTSVSPQISPNVCTATTHGHFALVIESFLSQTQYNTNVSRWKIIVGSTLGGALGVFLLGLLFHAMLVKVKKKSERVQMERRAYEEEALQISMVGHVRAPMASGTRTQPSLEHEYIPPI